MRAGEFQHPGMGVSKIHLKVVAVIYTAVSIGEKPLWF